MMSNTANQLRLYRNELAIIRLEGVPFYPAEEHVGILREGRIDLTPRGKLFYRTACETYGVAEERVECVRTVEQLEDLILAVRRRKRHGLGPKSVSKQGVDSVAATVAPAGLSNVIAVNFKRRCKAP